MKDILPEYDCHTWSRYDLHFEVQSSILNWKGGAAALEDKMSRSSGEDSTEIQGL